MPADAQPNCHVHEQRNTYKPISSAQACGAQVASKAHISSHHLALLLNRIQDQNLDRGVPEEFLQVTAWAFNVNENTLGRIVAPAVECEPGGKAMDKGPEPDALHSVTNHEPEAMNRPVCSAGFHARILPETGPNSNRRLAWKLVDEPG